jgi:hypothetical protein
MGQSDEQYIDIIATDDAWAKVEQLLEQHKDVVIERGEREPYHPGANEFTGLELVAGLKIAIVCLKAGAAGVAFVTALIKLRNEHRRSLALAEGDKEL